MDEMIERMHWRVRRDRGGPKGAEDYVAPTLHQLPLEQLFFVTPLDHWQLRAGQQLLINRS